MDDADAGAGYNCLVPGSRESPWSSIRQGAFLVALVVAGCVSCNSTHKALGTGGSGGSRPDARGTGGVIADANVAGTGGSSDCPYPSGFADVGGGMCGFVTSTMIRSTTDVLLVLDRSSSMGKSLVSDCLCTAGTGDEGGSVCSGTAGCTDRWTAVKGAVVQVIASTADIHWGVELFPTPAGSLCSVSPTPQLPVGHDSGAMAQAQLDANSPAGNTPTAAAISAATAYLSALTDQSLRVIVLATDGEPNCGVGQSSPTGNDLEATVAAITAAGRAGFLVYVLGAGPSVGDLDTMAQAGGTARHYPATSPEQLSAAFSMISQVLTSCTFTLADPPPDPNNVAVYENKQLVPKDSTNGWNFGTTTSTILLLGSYCDNLRVAETTTVQILFGCPGGAFQPCIP